MERGKNKTVIQVQFVSENMVPSPVSIVFCSTYAENLIAHRNSIFLSLRAFLLLFQKYSKSIRDIHFWFLKLIYCQTHQIPSVAQTPSQFLYLTFIHNGVLFLKIILCLTNLNSLPLMQFRLAAFPRIWHLHRGQSLKIKRWNCHNWISGIRPWKTKSFPRFKTKYFRVFVFFLH